MIRAESADAMASRMTVHCEAAKNELNSADAAFKDALDRPHRELEMIDGTTGDLVTAQNHVWKLYLVQSTLEFVARSH